MKLMAIRISTTPLLYNHKKMLDKKTNFGVWNASQFWGGGCQPKNYSTHIFNNRLSQTHTWIPQNTLWLKKMFDLRTFEDITYFKRRTIRTLTPNLEARVYQLLLPTNILKTNPNRIRLCTTILEINPFWPDTFTNHSFGNQPLPGYVYFPVQGCRSVIGTESV